MRKGRRGAGKSLGPAVHDDHVQRDFTAQRPDQVWVTDITEHPAAEGKLYCRAIEDLFSIREVGYSIDEADDRAAGRPVSWSCTATEDRNSTAAAGARDELHQAVVFWSAPTYSRRRRQRALAKLTPVEFGLAFTCQAAIAA